jgi:AcrR family transcriptional regulator
MSEPVKKRPYRSSVRQEQAAQTRRRILDAAWSRFESAGYGRTTIREIASEADVAIDTVYASFGTKARILTALIDARLNPGNDRVNVMERPEAQAVRDETDPRRQIQLFARDIAGISQRVRPVYEMLRTAAAVEPEMGKIFAEMDRYRLANMTRVADWFAARGPLRVPVADAAATIWALASPDVARMLCDGLGRSTDEYAAWLEDVLVQALLPDATSPTRRRQAKRRS